MALNARIARLSVLVILGALLFIWHRDSVAAADMNSTLIIGNSKIDVTIDSGDMKLTQAELLHWVQSAAEAAATYYGRYPVPHVKLEIIPVEGHGVRHGQTWGRNGGMIKIRVGAETRASELAEDWMLTHEMIHLGFPSVPENHHWIEEGIAVYVEPIARIQAKQMTAAQMWSDLVRDMPKGLPQSGDEGLDHTHTWGRTYWGGALFCFVADLEIRRQTHNQKGLQDALRGILYAGGDITEDWELQRALALGDKATGTSVLSDLYAKWKDQPVNVDLSGIWMQLGIEYEAGSVRLVDAPLAPIRRAITDVRESKAAEARPATVFAGRSKGKSAQSRF